MRIDTTFLRNCILTLETGLEKIEESRETGDVLPHIYRRTIRPWRRMRMCRIGEASRECTG